MDIDYTGNMTALTPVKIIVLAIVIMFNVGFLISNPIEHITNTEAIKFINNIEYASKAILISGMVLLVGGWMLSFTKVFWVGLIVPWLACLTGFISFCMTWYIIIIK